jgi:hypothetical protein
MPGYPALYLKLACDLAEREDSASLNLPPIAIGGVA